MTGKKWRHNPQVVARKIGEDMILVPTGRGIVDLQCLFTLNDTGCFIWEQLVDPRNAVELSTALVEQFEVPREQAEEDLSRFLTELAQEGCIVEEMDNPESSGKTGSG
jgi:hypothetical protein